MSEIFFEFFFLWFSCLRWMDALIHSPVYYYCYDNNCYYNACPVAGTVGMVAAGGILAAKRAKEGVRLVGVI